MGLDVYCRVVVGVKLLDHAKSEKTTVKETWYHGKTGEPYQREVTAHILTIWNGDRYEEGWSSDAATSLPGIGEFEEWLGDHGLALYSNNNSGYVLPGDLIGAQVGEELSMRGGPLTAMAPIIDEEDFVTIRARLATLGLEVEPSVYITMELNS